MRTEYETSPLPIKRPGKSGRAASHLRLLTGKPGASNKTRGKAERRKTHVKMIPCGVWKIERDKSDDGRERSKWKGKGKVMDREIGVTLFYFILFILLWWRERRENIERTSLYRINRCRVRGREKEMGERGIKIGGSTKWHNADTGRMQRGRENVRRQRES